VAIPVEKLMSDCTRKSYANYYLKKGMRRKGTPPEVCKGDFQANIATVKGDIFLYTFPRKIFMRDRKNANRYYFEILIKIPGSTRNDQDS
jgi:hypothetical protein